jgi:cyclopropane fatty-acyl-phospholipid synthase-like methyltransferase
MDPLIEQDVPYGNNWDSPVEAAAYGESADQARPWRAQIRDHIATRIAALRPGARVLELGSGPGLLAHRVLQRCPDLATYTLVDFSEAMLTLSRERLAVYPAARYVLASFKSDEWTQRLDGRFDCVVSMQAVHELRHKRHARRLYEQVGQVLAVRGLFLVCDHTPLDDSPKSTALYLTEEEQERVLADAGFVNVHVALAMHGLVLYAAERMNEVRPPVK